jgi:hypothetical protein
MHRLTLRSTGFALAAAIASAAVRAQSRQSMLQGGAATASRSKHGVLTHE